MVRNTAPRTEKRTEASESTDEQSGWPLGREQQHQLMQALEFVNDALRRSQTVYDLYCEDGLDADESGAAAEACRATAGHLGEAGEAVEALENDAPDLWTVSEEEMDACTSFYSKVGEVNSSLESAWEELTAAAAAADERATGSGWGQVADADQIVTRLADARDALWMAQARLEKLLVEEFDHSETDFDRPATDFDW